MIFKKEIVDCLISKESGFIAKDNTRKFPSQIHSSGTVIKVSQGKICAFVNSGDKSILIRNFSIVEMYNFQEDSREKKRNLPSLPRIISSAIINNKIFILLTPEENDNFSEVYIYETETDSWFSATHLPSALRFSGVTSLKNKLYAIGEKTGDSEISNTCLEDNITKPDKY